MSCVAIHYNEWIASKVDPEIIKLNVTSLSGNAAYERLLYALGEDARRNDGRLREKWIERYNHLDKGGWWCGGIDPLTFTNSDWGCFKPDDPKTIDGKPIKYEHPPQTATEIFALKIPDNIWKRIANRFPSLPSPKEGEIFWKALINSPEVPLVITEGAKKAGALLTAGYPAIALPGINSGYRNDGGEKKLIPDLEVFATEGREIIIAFDQDKRFKTRLRVKDAIKTYKSLFAGKNAKKPLCKVSVLAWDGEKGIDDLIASRGENECHRIFRDRLVYEDWFVGESKPALKLDFDQLFQFVGSELAEDFSFDELRSAIMFRGEKFTFGEEIRSWFYNEYGIVASKEDIREIILYFAKNKSYNPVSRYLDKVYKESTRISIDNLSSRYFATTDPLYDRLVKKWLISAVARGTKPGTKVDHVLVLFGNQGGYKSGFFDVLGGEFYDSSATNKLNDKDTKLIIHSCWIEEFAEYERLNKKEQGEVKHWFTLRFDNFRKPYLRETENHYRRCVFGATCNKHEFLVDETGDRRMWVIPVDLDALPGGKIDLELLAKERDGIWASAVDAYLAGEKWWNDREEEAEVSWSNEYFRSYDEWTEVIQGWIEGNDVQETTVRRILDEALQLPTALQDRKVQMRVADILTRLGWRKALKGGSRSRVWLAPGNQGDSQGGDLPPLKVDRPVDREVDHPVEPLQNGHSRKSAVESGDLPPQRSITPVDHPVEPLQNGDSSQSSREGDLPDLEKTKSSQKIEIIGDGTDQIEWVRYRGEVYLVAAIDRQMLSLRKSGFARIVHKVHLSQVEIGGYKNGKT